jgi:cytoskeletal protein CcmA (bactofilin family)
MFGPRKRSQQGEDMPKSSEEIHGFLGKGAEFQGQLKFEGSIQIDGIFKGEIEATGTLVVGEGARVEAEIQCGTLLVHGEIEGNARTTNRFEALAPARITGNIQTPVLVINEGVYLDGHVKMGTSEKDDVERQKGSPLLDIGGDFDADTEKPGRADE